MGIQLFPRSCNTLQQSGYNCTNSVLPKEATLEYSHTHNLSPDRIFSHGHAMRVLLWGEIPDCEIPQTSIGSELLTFSTLRYAYTKGRTAACTYWLYVCNVGVTCEWCVLSSEFSALTARSLSLSLESDTVDTDSKSRLT